MSSWVKIFENPSKGTVLVYKDQDGDQLLVKADIHVPGQGKINVSTVRCEDERSQSIFFENSDEGVIEALLDGYLSHAVVGTSQIH